MINKTQNSSFSLYRISYLIAFLTLGFFLASCQTRSFPSPRPVKKWAVLVPGLYSDPKSDFSAFMPALLNEGWEILPFHLQPNDGSQSIRSQAHQLRSRIDATIPPQDRIALIGFSMGGLIARSFVQELSGFQRVEALVTIGTPNQGTQTARLASGPALREMTPGSLFLQGLNRNSRHLLDHVATLAIWSPYDGAVLPSSNAQIPGAPNRRFPVLVHYRLMQDPTVLQTTLDHLRFIRSSPPSPTSLQ